jgi:uncharacterized membrane protein
MGEGDPRAEIEHRIIPTAYAWKLNDGDVAAVATYVRNAWGNSAPAVSAEQMQSLKKDREPMEKLADLRHELHKTEEHLLTKLRSLRRGLRGAPGQDGQDGSKMAAAQLTTGQRIADIVAASMGSWKFIIIQSVILMIWIALNVTAYVEQWDPYPFILLNLALSFQAAYAAPFIMMSQNRQQDIDRRSAEHDHQINIKAELEIELLHQKIDQLRETEVLYLTEAVKELTGLLRQAKIEPGPAAIN